MYQTGGVQGGGPTTGSGTPYGMVPNLPPYTTDTTQMVGTNAYPQLASILGAGYQGGLNQEMTNIGSLLKGIIPSDVLSQLYQSGAERGIGIGSPGSPNANAAMLRALGLTSLGLQEQGLGDLSKVIAQVPIQPSQTTTQTTDLGAARAGYAAAPDPRLAAEQALKNAMQGIAAGRGSVGAPQMPSAAQMATGSPAAWQGQSLFRDQTFYPATGYSDAGYTPTPALQSSYEPLGTTPIFGSASIYPTSQYGLPTWADTGSMMGFNLPGYGMSPDPTPSYGNMYTPQQIPGGYGGMSVDDMLTMSDLMGGSEPSSLAGLSSADLSALDASIFGYDWEE